MRPGDGWRALEFDEVEPLPWPNTNLRQGDPREARIHLDAALAADPRVRPALQRGPDLGQLLEDGA